MHAGGHLASEKQLMKEITLCLGPMKEFFSRVLWSEEERRETTGLTQGIGDLFSSPTMTIYVEYNFELLPC